MFKNEGNGTVLYRLMFVTLEEGIIEIEVKFMEDGAKNETKRYTLKDLQTKP